MRSGPCAKLSLCISDAASPAVHTYVKACPHLAFESGLMWIDHVHTIHTIRVNVD